MRRRSRSASKTGVPTDAEFLILRALWEFGESTVEDVVGRLSSSRPPNYKTVQSLLRIMEGKGFVQHTQRGRAFVFKSRVTRDEVGGRLAKHLLERTFGGSPSALLMNLLDRNTVNERELDELEALIHDYRQRKTEDDAQSK
jgi:BlaI family transcriptional regulator, penicillinase repressor